MTIFYKSLFIFLCFVSLVANKSNSLRAQTTDHVPTEQNPVITIKNNNVPGQVSGKPSLFNTYGDLFIEKWDIIAAHGTVGGSLDKQNVLTPQSFFKFVDHKYVTFRLNENYPIQYGEYTQSILWLDIKAYNNPDCPSCIDHFQITINSQQDQEYLLSFNGQQQLFSVKKTRKAP